MNHKSTPRFHDLDQQNLAIFLLVACRGRERLWGFWGFVFGFFKKINSKENYNHLSIPISILADVASKSAGDGVYLLHQSRDCFAYKSTNLPTNWKYILVTSREVFSVQPGWHHPKSSKKVLVKKLLSQESNGIFLEPGSSHFLDLSSYLSLIWYIRGINLPPIGMNEKKNANRKIEIEDYGGTSSLTGHYRSNSLTT